MYACNTLGEQYVDLYADLRRSKEDTDLWTMSVDELAELMRRWDDFYY